ncbi:hypothetical protein LTR62_003393 [Meristemomyces frigidus]|uniref:Uncharacterized protein n=1 Tax=Meristemomyces frigidus TaxID=1508187 RepID=A0AAN7YKR0_9PEZI|nr:hypothetical protein LTR62_003393 [Meristemomyces frigidus]
MDTTNANDMDPNSTSTNIKTNSNNTDSMKINNNNARSMKTNLMTTNTMNATAPADQTAPSTTQNNNVLISETNSLNAIAPAGQATPSTPQNNAFLITHIKNEAAQFAAAQWKLMTPADRNSFIQKHSLRASREEFAFRQQMLGVNLGPSIIAAQRQYTLAKQYGVVRPSPQQQSQLQQLQQQVPSQNAITRPGRAAQAYTTGQQQQQIYQPPFAAQHSAQQDRQPRVLQQLGKMQSGVATNMQPLTQQPQKVTPYKAPNLYLGSTGMEQMPPFAPTPPYSASPTPAAFPHAAFAYSPVTAPQFGTLPSTPASMGAPGHYGSTSRSATPSFKGKGQMAPPVGPTTGRRQARAKADFTPVTPSEQERRARDTLASGQSLTDGRLTPLCAMHAWEVDLTINGPVRFEDAVVREAALLPVCVDCRHREHTAAAQNANPVWQQTKRSRQQPKLCPVDTCVCASKILQGCPACELSRISQARKDALSVRAFDAQPQNPTPRLLCGCGKPADFEEVVRKCVGCDGVRTSFTNCAGKLVRFFAGTEVVASIGNDKQYQSIATTTQHVPAMRAPSQSAAAAAPTSLGKRRSVGISPEEPAAKRPQHGEMPHPNGNQPRFDSPAERTTPPELSKAGGRKRKTDDAGLEAAEADNQSQPKRRQAAHLRSQSEVIDLTSPPASPSLAPAVVPAQPEQMPVDVTAVHTADVDADLRLMSALEDFLRPAPASPPAPAPASAPVPDEVVPQTSSAGQQQQEQHGDVLSAQDAELLFGLAGSQTNKEFSFDDSNDDNQLSPPTPPAAAVHAAYREEGALSPDQWDDPEVQQAYEMFQRAYGGDDWEL